VLDQSSYITGIAFWALSALGLMLCLWRWSAGRLAPHWRCLLLLEAAALLLTPAYPDAQTRTMAPALVVSLFEGLFNAPGAAVHALRPLLFMMALGPVLTLVLYLVVWRRRGRRGAGA